jgi:ring-1,2-phenylacetyl-CoA epoxidase subunit PaaD
VVTAPFSALTRDDLWRALEAVLDPEVPALSVVDLGIVRDVRVDGDRVEVDITPTYSGCPALEVMRRDIAAALSRAGARHVVVNTVFQPAWTTDWMSESARERLRAYGIAPPRVVVHDAGELIPLRRVSAVPCPFCGSTSTELRSAFGSTACKALHYCSACRQPFEEFKAI